MLKKLFISLALFLVLSSSTSYTLSISEKQFQELIEILQTYTTLTGELKTTLIQQKQTLDILQKKSTEQEKTIRQLLILFQNLKQQTKDLENSYLKYKRTQEIKNWILYGTIGILAVANIYLLLK